MATRDEGGRLRPKEIKVDEIIEVPESPFQQELSRSTTMMLTERHYNFLQAVRYYEKTTLNNKRISMSDILKNALDAYQEKYEKDQNIKINDKGIIVK